MLRTPWGPGIAGRGLAFMLLPACARISDCKYLSLSGKLQCTIRLAMSVVCCVAKICYYLGLILYHVCDIGLDWYTSYNVLHIGNQTAVGDLGISISPNSTVAKFLFWSCVNGTFFSLIMVWVYGYYINHHLDCIANECAGYHSVSNSDMKCDRRFVALELWISVLELLGKDDIQSAILFGIYTSQSVFKTPSPYFIAFSVCSVVAHLKLCTCFFTKTFGFGRGEKSCFDDGPCRKRFVAYGVMGLITAVLALLLMVITFAVMLEYFLNVASMSSYKPLYLSSRETNTYVKVFKEKIFD